MLLDSYGKPIEIETQKLTAGHFATALKAQDFTALLSLLPDPDIVLRRKGLEYRALRELLVDSHLEAVMNVRYAAVSGAKWRIVPGGEDSKSMKEFDLIYEMFQSLPVPDIIEEKMEHVAFGYKPMELLWLVDGKYWYINAVAGKPQEWFSFNQERELVFKTGYENYEPLPPFKFICPRFRSTYKNPYGEKLLSKSFWPVTFKRTGFTWWTSFVEKYGGAFMFGTYPIANEKIKDKLLDALSGMVSDAVAAIPAGSDVKIHEATGKASSSNVYKEYIEASNNEISKTWLGQTLTTQTSSHGNLATATVHDRVRDDINISDQRRITGSFNEMIYFATLLNFGETETLSKFEFYEEADLSIKADLDTKIFSFSGYQPTPEYLEEAYGIKKEYLQKKEQAGSGLFKKRFFKKNDEIKLSKEDKQEIKNQKITDKFGEKKAESFQSAVDNIITSLTSEIQKANDYNDVYELVLDKYPELEMDEVIEVMNNIQFASSQIGAFEKQKGFSLFGKKKSPVR